MKLSLRSLAALIAGAALFLMASPSKAALALCNRTSYVLYAATGTALTNGVQVQGWTRVVPGLCQTVVPGDLTAPSYYLYARTSQAHSGPSRAWGGGTPICVKDTNFTSRDTVNPQACASDDFFKLPFAAIDTHRLKNWTTTFSESPSLANLQQAQRAGIKRLLRDIGYRIGNIDASPDKASDGALADFRKRAKLAPNATAADLFDALETEALKSAAPAGYAVCNDTAKAVAAAIGQKAGNEWVAHGWWKVAAGSCAKVLDNVAGMDSVYLFVQKIGGPPLVTGPAKFCVADIEFDIQGRGRCAQRGLTEFGFAETKVKGLTGFAAHVGETGLINPAAPRHAPK
jgi:uncharacterized membrane protein